MQTNLFDIIQPPEEPKRFVAKLFRVECFWHCKIIKGIDIQDRDEYYAIENTEKDAWRVIKSILFKKGHTGKIGFEYPHRPFNIHPIFFYKGMQVEVMEREGMYILQKKISDKMWEMIGSVPECGEFVLSEIWAPIDQIKPCNSLELSAKYRAKGYIQ